MNSISARANLNEINYFPINFLSYKWNSGIDIHIEADNSRRALFSIIWQHIKGKWSHFFLFMRGPLQLKYVKYGLLILKKSGSFVEIRILDAITRGERGFRHRARLIIDQFYHKIHLLLIYVPVNQEKVEQKNFLLPKRCINCNSGHSWYNTKCKRKQSKNII